MARRLVSATLGLAIILLVSGLAFLETRTETPILPKPSFY